MNNKNAKFEILTPFKFCCSLALAPETISVKTHSIKSRFVSHKTGIHAVCRHVCWLFSLEIQLRAGTVKGLRNYKRQKCYSAYFRLSGFARAPQSQGRHNIDRLEKRGVERGSDRRSSLKGRERAIVNETNIRTVLKATTGKHLRDGMERTWAFPSS